MDFECIVEMPVEDMRNIFGSKDQYIRKLEKDFSVSIVDRNGAIRVIGEETHAKRVRNILLQLSELSRRGNDIEEQNVDYAITMGMEEKESVLTEIDKDTICHTINGKPIKPKTLGQKEYVDAIRNNMIVFGLGPAGTGKPI